MGRKIGDIFETRDYDMFKTADYNRQVSTQRAKKIIGSIKQNGYILNPICVNEHFEVIDGQGRLEALRALNLPVHYYIEPGAGKKECIALNSYNTLWTIYDYVCSYASSGNENYIRFKTLCDTFTSLGADTVYFVATGTVSAQHKIIKEGRLIISQEQYENAMKGCTALLEFAPGVSNIKGNQKKVYQAIYFALGCDGVDESKLKERINYKYNMAPAIANLDQALKALSDIYNFRSKTDPIYLEVEYDKFQRGKFTWYAKKWGDKKKAPELEETA